MSVDTAQVSGPRPDRQARQRELLAFFALSVLIWPIIAIGVVASWGLVVWIYHAYVGLPGPGQ